MVHYCKCPSRAAHQAAHPKSGWELLAEAQAEAAGNARIGPPQSAPPLPAAQPATQNATGAYILAPTTSSTPGYYYYSVSFHPCWFGEAGANGP